MKVAVAKEIEAGENRVALIPDVVARLVKQGFEICVESGAGDRAYFTDNEYENAGATIIHDTARLWAEADAIVKVAPPTLREVDQMRSGSITIGFCNPLGEPTIIARMAERGVTAFAIELIPRTSRAQSMDALSSQAGLAGYKATLLAAAALPKFFPMLTTAAGTIRPAKVFVVGAGVAGLQAIATSRRLGAVVEAFDIRPAVKEEVQSLGAKFVEVKLEEETVAAGGYAREISTASKQRTQEVLADHVAQADVVITTAQVPGKVAPRIVTDGMVAQMKPGSVVIDLAANQGGNCEGSEPGATVIRHGVTIIGAENLPSSMPIHASQMYAKNIATLLALAVDQDGQFNLDFDDDIIDSACITHGGEVRNERVRSLLESMTQGSVATS
ncbi:MAG: Re/Si-specific NAD(P)(+) transhydrogenase subunit alpha [Coleofasciculaceae cyanobacterium RL_1_1]|nr:Re/Si-specific NAD(P)(+) transhydrogenase subunit alpha [Coleofasciculaceae cyanobacterium RL_1_1]